MHGLDQADKRQVLATGLSVGPGETVDDASPHATTSPGQVVDAPPCVRGRAVIHTQHRVERADRSEESEQATDAEAEEVTERTRVNVARREELLARAARLKLQLTARQWMRGSGKEPTGRTERPPLGKPWDLRRWGGGHNRISAFRNAGRNASARSQRQRSRITLRRAPPCRAFRTSR